MTAHVQPPVTMRTIRETMERTNRERRDRDTSLVLLRQRQAQEYNRRLSAWLDALSERPDCMVSRSSALNQGSSQ